MADDARGQRTEPLGPPDALVVPRFAGPDTFARLPRLDDVGTAAVALVGVPFDAGVSYRSGARFGPAAIRAGSKLLRPYHPGLDVEPWRATRWPMRATSPATRSTSARRSPPSRRGAAELSTGADRLVSPWAATTRSPSRSSGRCTRGVAPWRSSTSTPISTPGTRTSAQPYTHGTPFRRAFEEGLLASERSVHVGIRGPLYSTTDLEQDAGMGFEVISTADVARHGVDHVIARIRERVGRTPVYVSVDIDVLDPAHAPGTGTPEPGGLTTRELQFILRAWTAWTWPARTWLRYRPPTTMPS